MSTKRLPSLFRKKSERFPGDGGYEVPRSQSRTLPEEPPQSSPEGASGDDHADPLREEPAHGGSPSVDVTLELQTQLQSAVWRCNNLEARLDRALRETALAKEHRDGLLTSLAQAEAKAEKSERESQWKGAELERMKKELGEEREKREAAERELEQQKQQVELLEWKLQEQEEHAVGLRSIAAQAEGSMELARAEISAIEAKCKDEVAQAREEADTEVAKMKLVRDEAQEKVSWLEEELMAVRGKVSLLEFRLREEVSRSDALIAEADELTEKLREAEDLLEVCYREYGVPRKGQKKAAASLPEASHRLDEQGLPGSSGTHVQEPCREEPLHNHQQQQQQQPSVATAGVLGGLGSRGLSFSGNRDELSDSRQQSSSEGADPTQRLSGNSSPPSVHMDAKEGESWDREEAEVASLRVAPLSPNHNS